ncbi:MAG: 5'-methylthioadenosine/S-adenosylhomocysteine nucleosidase [Anaerolineaceae bacterium]|nr:5'-methylthioadenosine/S-adenosylhomocysteine nucleosidase [Anaerolineaceae bacterium]
MNKAPKVAVVLSADYEWQTWCSLQPEYLSSITPYGGCFEHFIETVPVLSIQGGWGKVSASASTQWIIDHYDPDLIINLGTCGGLDGQIERQTIVLVERTYQYDIQEQMTDPEDARRFYSCEMDLTWLGNRSLPTGVIRGTMFSADRDILPSDVEYLIGQHAALVADWESGAIAWVAKQNQKPLIILRGVSDIVNSSGGESYGKINVFQENTRKIMEQLAGQLPWWIQAFTTGSGITFPI